MELGNLDMTGTGNLIIGNNQLRGDSECPDGVLCDRRDGSHMLVIGDRNNYTSIGGMVVGNINETISFYSSVIGGSFNEASGLKASVSGGHVNTASGSASSVSGGYFNTASGHRASVSGGDNREAKSIFCWEDDPFTDC